MRLLLSCLLLRPDAKPARLAAIMLRCRMGQWPPSGGTCFMAATDGQTLLQK